MAELEKLAVIIGTAKAGTTALANHLGGHPEAVLGRIKEPRFFTDFKDRDWTGPGTENFRATLITDWREYVANFGGLQRSQWAIDASTDYIWSPETPRLLAEASKHMEIRLICVVRDPVDRAVSEYNHTLRGKWENLSFTEALDAEQSRREMGWHPLFYHKRRSTILEDLQTFSGLFGSRLLVIDYGDLRDAQGVTDRMCDFLSISRHSIEQIERKNESILPRNRLASSILSSQAVKQTARALAPRHIRKRAWRGLHSNARHVKTVEQSERETFRELISGEIDRCVQSPLVPTRNWTCTEKNVAL